MAQKSCESQQMIVELGAVDIFIRLYSLGNDEGRINAARYLVNEPEFMRVMQEEQRKEGKMKDPIDFLRGEPEEEAIVVEAPPDDDDRTFQEKAEKSRHRLTLSVCMVVLMYSIGVCLLVVACRGWGRGMQDKTERLLLL